jgi:hypothetical protein
MRVSAVRGRGLWLRRVPANGGVQATATAARRCEMQRGGPPWRVRLTRLFGLWPERKESDAPRPMR